VTAETSTTASIINIPPNSTMRYSTGLTMSQATGLHFSAAENFYKVTVPRLAEVPITATNHNMSGAFLYTEDTTPFIAVWGQDAGANLALPSIDVGTSVVPLPSSAIQKHMILFSDEDDSGTITWSDVVRFTLRAYNNTVNPLPDGIIEDNLPTNVTYVAGSSTVNNGPIPDDSGSKTPFPFDEGGLNIGVIPGLSFVTVTFDTIVNVGANSIQNTALTSSPGITPTDPGGIDIAIEVARYQLDKRLIQPANGVVARGKPVQFGIVITSTGNISLTKLPLKDTFIEEHLTFQSAIQFAPDSIAAGSLGWNDLAASNRFGPLPPGRAIALTVTFIVDNVPPVVTTTFNLATVQGAEGSDGAPLPP
jgi:uncharacterized repeat protein (TIGR01451 family)